MSFVTQVMILLKKDFLIELRRKELLALSLSLAVILSAVTSFAVQSAFIPAVHEVALFPGLSWVIYLFCATLAVARTYEHDLEFRALDALLQSGIWPTAFYISKVIGSFMLGMITYFATALFLALFMGLDFFFLNWGMFFIAALVVLAYSALAALIATLTQNSTLKSFLFPLIFLPLLFPVFFMAIELSASAQAQQFSFNSPLVAFLLAANVIYFLAGINLFIYTIKK